METSVFVVLRGAVSGYCNNSVNMFPDDNNDDTARALIRIFHDFKIKKNAACLLFAFSGPQIRVSI